MTKKQLKQYCVKVFGSKQKACIWMRTPNAFTKHKKPKNLLTRRKTRQLVLEELIRIEHGIFA